MGCEWVCWRGGRGGKGCVFEAGHGDGVDGGMRVMLC